MANNSKWPIGKNQKHELFSAFVITIILLITDTVVCLPFNYPIFSGPNDNCLPLLSFCPSVSVLSHFLLYIFIVVSSIFSA